MRVAHVVDRLDARCAGVAYAVAHWASAERALGIEAQIVTADHRRLPPMAWVATGARALRAVKTADVVHLHGLWTPSTWITGWTAALARTPFVVTPHGMLDPWALRRSRWKKAASATVFEGPIVSRAACIHVLCASELRAARAFGCPGSIAVIPPGIDEGLLSERCDPRQDEPYVLFLGRLHPKKGIGILIRAFAATRRRHPGWRLVIAGPDEIGHRAELEAVSRGMGVADAVSFPGAVHGREKLALLLGASLFALTSQSEGLPVAVLEAMACGVPVLISRQCNLEGVSEAGAGFVGDTSVERAAELLDVLCAFDRRRRQEMGARGRDLVMQRFTRRSAADGLIGVYRWLLRGGSPPPQVQEAEA
jgi:glycosyltransferase involved in cell wall biosynthesis